MSCNEYTYVASLTTLTVSSWALNTCTASCDWVSLYCEGYYKIDPINNKAYLQHNSLSFTIFTPHNEASKKEVTNMNTLVKLLLSVVLY